MCTLTGFLDDLNRPGQQFNGYYVDDRHMCHTFRGGVHVKLHFWACSVTSTFFVADILVINHQ